MKFRKLLLIGGMCLTAMTLSSCMSLIGIPSVSVDNHLGDNKIGNEFDRVAIWAGDTDYDKDGVWAHIKKEDTEVYQMIQAEINRSKQTGEDIETSLNNSDLGIVCKNYECRYDGYYIIRGNNISTESVPSGKFSNKYDIYLTFNPNNLGQTYNIEISKTELD